MTISSDDRETLSSYKVLVRRIVLEAQAPVVQVIFPFRWDVESGKLPAMKRRAAHGRSPTVIKPLWGTQSNWGKSGSPRARPPRPNFGHGTVAHPGDAGYAVFAEAAWSAFQEAVEAKRVCQAPAKMLYDETYLTSTRTRLSSLEPLPRGWKVRKPHVDSRYYDMLMSRWLDDEVVAVSSTGKGTEEKPATAIAPERLATSFRGSMVMLFGESTPKSCKYRCGWMAM